MMNTKLSRVITVILTLSLSLFLISAAVKATLAFRQLYYFDLDHLNIASDYGMSKEEIIKNYNILIDYTQKKSISKLIRHQWHYKDHRRLERWLSRNPRSRRMGRTQSHCNDRR